MAVDPVIVEDGTIVAGANSYVSVAEANKYHDERLNDGWTNSGVRDRQKAVIAATQYLIQQYRLRWQGIRVDVNQTLDWPRAGVILDDYYNPTGRPYYWPGSPVEVPHDVVPEEVKIATYEAAERARVSDLLQDSPSGGANVKRLKAGSAEIEYFANSTTTQTYYPTIDRTLWPLLKGTPGTVQLLRA